MVTWKRVVLKLVVNDLNPGVDGRLVIATVLRQESGDVMKTATL